MKITMYELLGMVKDDKKLPKKIKVLDVIYEFDDHYGDYFNEPLDRYLFVYMTSEEEWKLAFFLNTEVEIIEEPQEHKIPKKLDIVLLDQSDNWTRKYNKNLKDFESAHIELNPYVIDVIRQNTLEFQSKINEILDYLEVNNEFMD